MLRAGVPKIPLSCDSAGKALSSATYPQVSLIGPGKTEVHTPLLMLRRRNPQKLIVPRRFSTA
jgi:hypothetical protein